MLKGTPCGIGISLDSGEIASSRVGGQQEGGRSDVLQTTVEGPCGGVCSVHIDGQRWFVEERGLARDLLAEDFDCIENPESVANACDAHFLESLLVEVEKNIAANIVGAEDVLVASALYVMKPTGDVIVSPGAQEGGIGHALGGVCGDILLIPDGLEGEPDIYLLCHQGGTGEHRQASLFNNYLLARLFNIRK